jgi:hypothetical protein
MVYILSFIGEGLTDQLLYVYVNKTRKLLIILLIYAQVM